MRFPCFGTGNAFVPYLPKVMEGLKTVVSRSAVPFWTNWGFLSHRVQVEFPCLSHPGRVHRVDFLWERDDGTLIAGEFDGVQKYVDPLMTAGRTIRQVVDDERDRQQC